MKISIVSYLNSFPFLYGLEHSGLISDCEILRDVPAVCAERLKCGEVVAGLVPVGALPEMEGVEIVSGFGITSSQHVDSVLLLSQVPIDKVTTITLDSESRSSNALTRILAKHHWERELEWILPTFGNNSDAFPETIVAIGDKAFSKRQSYKYTYDLASEWYDMTGLPFVFAVWAGVRKDLPKYFEEALGWGVNHIDETIKCYGSATLSDEKAKEYLVQKIQYCLGKDHYTAIELFLRLLKEITPQ